MKFNINIKIKSGSFITRIEGIILQVSTSLKLQKPIPSTIFCNYSFSSLQMNYTFSSISIQEIIQLNQLTTQNNIFNLFKSTPKQNIGDSKDNKYFIILHSVLLLDGYPPLCHPTISEYSHQFIFPRLKHYHGSFKLDHVKEQPHLYVLCSQPYLTPYVLFLNL